MRKRTQFNWCLQDYQPVALKFPDFFELVTNDLHPALELYLLYRYEAQLQQSNEISLSSEVCMERLCIGNHRFYHAKRDLIELGYIKIIRGRDKKGKLQHEIIKLLQ